jgi:osmotically-inducible protein OsmY
LAKKPKDMNAIEQKAEATTQHFLNQPCDTDLVGAAADAIACLTTVPADTIKVTAQGGWLHLEGTVDSDSKRIIVEEVIRPLNGVRGVFNSIEVRSFQSCPD